MSDQASHRTPVVLIIRDGWGHNPNPEHDSFNAIKLARTPVADRLMEDYPNTLLTTCGEDVGLPRGTMGNSEVGHQNIGAGRVVDQELLRISGAIAGGSFFDNGALLGAFAHAHANGSSIHLMGLLSDGQVHSDIDHVFALIELAVRNNFPGDRLFIHVFTDGRDTGPRTGLGFVQQLEAKLQQARVGRIASVIGRFYAMDRDHRWERVQQAFEVLTGRSPKPPSPLGRGVGGEGSSTHHTPTTAIQSYYDNPVDQTRTGDEFITPTIIESASPDANSRISDNDAVIFFNFRGDRPREITRAFVLDDEAWSQVKSGGFDRGARLNNLHFCTMTAYEAALPVTSIAFHKPPHLPNTLGQAVADAGLTQFRCAETEKFAHVTYFFNDYREEPFPGEERLLCPSPRDVSTYDQKPEMSGHDVCTGVLKALGRASPPDLIIVNFANPDMVGHTGSLAATITAVEVVDACVGQIIEATLALRGSLIVTADHGNAEQMWNPTHDCPHTAHTTFDVPLIVVGPDTQGTALRPGGSLADIAPALLHLMGLEKPVEMTGEGLLVQSLRGDAPTSED